MAFLHTINNACAGGVLIGQTFIILRLLFPQKHASDLLVKWKTFVHSATLLPFFQVVPTDRREWQ